MQEVALECHMVLSSAAFDSVDVRELYQLGSVAIFSCHLYQTSYARISSYLASCPQNFHRSVQPFSGF